MTTESDQMLLERARAGDGAALDQLLERHQGQVYRFGLKMCRDPEDAKDVLQDTFLAMARSVRDFRGASSVSTWLYSVARSFCIKKRRRPRPEPSLTQSLDVGDGPELVDSARGPDELAASREIELALETAIASLDPIYREVLILRDAEGLTAPEVAEVLGLTVEAVKSRLHRARAMVRERIAPVLGIAEPSPSCPDVLSLFSRHLEGEISADVCAEMERHLQHCERCRSACHSLQRTLQLCRTTGSAAPVPTSVQASVKLALRNVLSAKG